ncbi:glycine--tRNA ligase [Candidatus Bathyarchaeota archaeon]|nr:glycine--tRNA ligase [Candidatus Bathyarchaeota archaeon]NIV44249.1 glycine--tRNA ligase [Candidatus Bathyarchaeota archaeon]
MIKSALIGEQKRLEGSDKFEIINELAKRRGFFWPSFEIYGGVGGFITFGPLGAVLKRRIEDKFRAFYIRPLGIFEMESSVILPAKVFEASGHVNHFKEPMIECGKCKRKFRADHLLQELAEMSDTETEKLGVEQLVRQIRKHEIRCPECRGEFSEAKQFMTMFSTTIGPYSDAVGYGRPEAAQSIFVEFKRLYENARERLPFGVVQIGHALRNEISPRQGVIRLREFTIMDIEFFFDPEESECPLLENVENEKLRLLLAEAKLKGKKEPIEVTTRHALDKGFIKTEWQAFFMAQAKRFLMELGVPEDKQRFIEKLDWERAHYSTQGFDQEIYVDRWGWVEVSGHNYRTDYDLKQHMEFSGVDMRVFKEGRRFIPHVVEPSFGSDRLVYIAVEFALKSMEKRTVLSFPRDVAPTQIGIYPLVRKNGIPEKAKVVHQLLVKEGFFAEYDESGSIGRRYARADEVGTPLGVTIDYRTLEDDTVTIRDRDTWKQVRNKTERLPGVFHDYFSSKLNFEDLGEPVKD